MVNIYIVNIVNYNFSKVSSLFGFNNFPLDGKAYAVMLHVTALSFGEL